MPTDKRALTEDLIRDADGLFVGLLRNAMIGVYIIQDNLFRYANPRFAEIFGYTQAEICGVLGPRELIAPSEEDKVLGAISQRLDGLAETAHYVFTGLRKDGGRIDLEVFGNRTEFEGRPAIIGMLVDITARCAAERTANEQLNFIGQLIEAIPSPLFFKDEKARYLGCNKAFEAFIMRPRDAIIGRSVFDISPPELAARYHEADKALFDHPGVQTYEASVEAADGMRRDVIFNKATWLHADGSLGGLVGVITDITERKQTEALVWVQANYDPLTGLPNRRLLHDRLSELLKKAHRDQESVAVLYIDLDRFKEVNDTLGHEAGDRLLVDAARRIVGCVRESDTVARQGGDEFTVLLPGLSDRLPLERIADDIIQALDRPFTLGDDLAYVSASIGITFFPQDATSPIDILKNADQAMYHAKDAGRNRFSYFSPTMQENALQRLQLGRDLRSALAEGQLELHFQPILHLASGEVRKAEALLRWTHPDRGAISPVVFIPIAESSGLISEIGDWVFRSAADQVQRWRSSLDPQFQISVNRSPAQFRSDASGGPGWGEQLAQRGLPGDSIVVEITEGLLLDTGPGVTDQLHALKQAGLPISLDDFGTGYSAMAYLQKFDIDYLKIDRRFVSGMQQDATGRALCKAIIVMAHELGMKVVAEGVETAEQRDWLKAAGCDHGQGFLFARPMVPEQFERWLAEHRSHGTGGVPAAPAAPPIASAQAEGTAARADAPNPA